MVKAIKAAFAGASAYARLSLPRSSQGQRGVAATGFVIGIAVAILVAALIVPIAFDSFFGADTASWDAQTILIWGIIPVVGLLTIVLYFLNRADSQA